MSYSTNSVTTSKAARLLGLAPASVKKLYASGALRYVQVGDKKVVHLTEIERYQRYGAFDPKLLEEQANAQQNKKPSQIKKSEIFRSDNLGATLPQEDSSLSGRGTPPTSQEAQEGQGHYAEERARNAPADPTVSSYGEVDRRADGRASRHLRRLRDNRVKEANDPSGARTPRESLQPNGVEGRFPLDEVEERFHGKVK